MSASFTLIFIVGCFLWLLRYRFRDNFLRAYGLFFLILVVYASNKLLYGIPEEMSEGAFSPLSLVRWGLLAVFVWYAVRLRMPAQFRPDIALGALGVLLLIDILLSGLYADDLSYALLRGVSFVLLAVAMMTGMAFYLYWNTNCLRFFKLKYYVAWIVLVPLLLLHLTGLGQYGVTVLMGQYAGLFGNQNMFGTFSAFITPYVLFHWRVVARGKLEWWLDVGLLAAIFLGLWLSNSRNGLISCAIAIATYFFVVNLQSRLKIIAVGLCMVVVLAISPTLKSDLTRFIRKGTDRTAQITNVRSQFFEEKRYAMWSGVLPLFWKKKLTGYGFASSHLLVFPFTEDKEVGRAVHNSYLEIFGDLGLPGLMLLLLLLYNVGTKVAVLLRQRGESLERNINAVFIAVFVAGSANAFFESWMFSVGNLASLMYWGPVAGIVARWAFRPVETRVPMDAPAAPLLRPVAAANRAQVS